MRYLRKYSPYILAVFFVLQSAGLFAFTRGEHIPVQRPLKDFALHSPDWLPVRDTELDQETLDVLKADDTLSRLYQNPTAGAAADLFVAFFATQRTGKTPHSPKNCLPGSGWVPTESGVIQIPIPREHTTISVNRYVVSRGANSDVVLYWYQGHGRVVASEFSAKIYTVMDSLRYRRSDTAIIRVAVPITGEDAAKATATGVAFIQSLFGALQQYLPA